MWGVRVDIKANGAGVSDCGVPVRNRGGATVVDRFQVDINYFIYYYPTILFISPLVEGRYFHVVAVGSLVLVLFLLVLPVRSHVQDLVVV